MKRLAYPWAATVLAASLSAAEEILAAPSTPAPAVAGSAAGIQSAERLDTLLGPVALYPDALIALILPASTVPSDIVLAARYLNEGGSQDEIDDEPWDDSVKALARYPDIIKWMDANLAWTKQLGEAFNVQPADVMNSVQRLRTKAKASGALVDTPQQKVIVEEKNIVIVPAQPDVIYVPYYDPTVVYVERTRYVSDPFISFGIGYSTGWWLGYGLDWHHHRLWAVDPLYRHRYWHDRYGHYHGWYYGGYRGPDFRSNPHYQPWRPRPSYPRSPRNDVVVHPRPPRDVVRPAPFPRAEMSRSTVSGLTPPRNVVPNDRPRSPVPRAPRPTNIVPTTSPSVTVPSAATTSPRIRPNTPPPGRPDGNRFPRSEQSVPRPDHNYRPSSGPRPERVSPPPQREAREGREVRPAPMPRPERSTTNSNISPSPRPAPQPPPSRGNSDMRRGGDNEREAR